MRKVFPTIVFLGLSGCVDPVSLVTLDVSRLSSPIFDAAELVTVSGASTLDYAGDAKLTDGRNLNPVLSKSLRDFDTVTLNFPANTVETIDGYSDYNVFAWRLTARHLGNGELRCDVSDAPETVIGLDDLVKLAAGALEVGVALATFEPVRGRTLIVSYNGLEQRRIVSMKFVQGEVQECP